MKGWSGHVVRGRGAQYVVLYISQKSGRVRVFDRGHPTSEYRSFQTFLTPEDAVCGAYRSFRNVAEARKWHPKAKRTKRFDLPAIKVRFRVSAIIRLIDADGDARCMGAEEVKAEQVLPPLEALLRYSDGDEWMPKTEIEILPPIESEDEPEPESEEETEE